MFARSSGQKQIAVCGTPGNDTYDEPRYRYGTERKLEADFPDEPEAVPPRLHQRQPSQQRRGRHADLSAFQ
ncbi:hypothetical protein P3W33_12950 [Luteibacter sp. PPL552]